MERLDRIIAEARSDANQDDPEASAGISQDKLVRWANHAQDKMQSLISSDYALFQVTEYEVNTTAGTEGYTISDRLFLNQRIIDVSISLTGLKKDKKSLRPRQPQNRNTESGQPSFYIRRGNRILLNPIPNSSAYKLYVEFERELDDIDIRRGKISSVTGSGTGGSPITAITLSASAPTPDSISTRLTGIEAGDYICVCDLNGNRIAYNLPVTAYNSGTRVLTVTSFVLDDEDTLPAANHYVTFGKYSRTHSQLPDAFEKYIQEYLVWKILSDNKSTEFSRRAEDRLTNTETELRAAFASLGHEIIEIPHIEDD